MFVISEQLTSDNLSETAKILSRKDNLPFVTDLVIVEISNTISSLVYFGYLPTITQTW